MSRHSRSRRRRGRRREGAALILVVVVVAALLAIAAPFVASMRLHERTARAFAGRSRARLLAQTKRTQALGHLLRSHPDEERRLRQAGGGDPDGEGVDTTDELTLPPTAPTGLRAVELASGTGDLAEVEVEDARARIDLNCSGPDPISNLLGVTVTTAILSYDEEKVLYVESIKEFYSDGDPSTIDGVVKVGHEYIGYCDTGYEPPAKGGEPDRPALLGLKRGLYFSRQPPPEERKAREEYFPRGLLVQDGRGDKITVDPLWRWLDTDRHGDLARFDSPAALRRIADWDFGRYRAALVLERYGVTLARLRGWGIQREQVEAAGLDAARLDEDAARKSETKEQREAREKAERSLRSAGLSVDLIRRFGGDAGVLRLANALEAMEEGQREKAVAQWRERQEQAEAQALKLDAWMKDEMKRQLRDLTELRDQASQLETVGRIELEEKVRPFMTTDAPPTAEAWSDPQPINHRVQYSPLQNEARIRPQDTRRFAAGMIVKVEPLGGGGAPEFRYCTGVTARDQVRLFPQLDRDYEAHTAQISCRIPTPVNVNTAKSEVMAAILTGLQSRVGQRALAGQGPDIVTPAEAQAIAERIFDERPASHLELRALLLALRQEGRITDQDVDAVYRNGIDPGDAMLLCSTVPFCFATGDVYELQAAGIVSDPAGNEVARYRTRETVRLAPPRDLVWTIDSQADFQDRVWVGGPLAQGVRPDPRDGGVASLFLPHAASNLTQTRPSYLGPYSARQWVFPSRSHAPGEGSIEPLPTHEPETGQGSNEPPGGTTVGRLHPEGAFAFDDQLDGIELRALGGGTILNTQLPHRHEALESGGTNALTSLGPLQMRGWLRLDRVPGRGQRGYIVDGGRANGVDHISLFIEDGELVLRADDEALDLRESGGAPRANEVRWRPNPPLTAGNWYHISAWVKGADRTDLALAVDGRLVGRETLGSRLARPLDAFATTITVEDASSFPDAGWVRIGANRRQQGTNDRGVGGTDRDAPQNVCEVLHYSSKAGNTLNVDAGSNRISDTIAILTQAGYTLQGRPTPDPGNTLPGSGRLPERGSGRVYTLRFTHPSRGATNIAVAMGYPHEEGTIVVPYGYTGRMKNDPPGATPSYQERLRVGGATLREALPIYTPSTLLYAPVPGYTRAAWNASRPNVPNGPYFDPYPQVLDAASTVIPTLWAAPYPDAPVAVRPPPPPPAPPPGGQPIVDDPPGSLAGLPNVVGGWPSVGVVRISSRKQPPAGGAEITSVERVLYRGIGPDGRLLNCIRGFEGTVAAPHYLWDSIVLESIVVSDPSDYADRATLADPRVLVSLDHPDGTEWLSVQKPTSPIALQAGLLLLPKRDSLLAVLPLPIPGVPGIDGDHFHYASQGPSGPSVGVGQRPPRADLIDQMLDGNGTLGPTPGLVVVRSPFAVNVGQPYKEVLKRWDDNWSRVAKGTARPAAAHAPGAKVVPTFFTRPIDAQESGRDDIVTVTDDAAVTPEREERRVVHGAMSVSLQDGINRLPPPLRALASDGLASRRDLTELRDPAQGWLLAFDDFVSREYTGAANGRIARWPTGNITQIPTSLSAGRARAPSGPGDTSPFAPGTLDARVDDVVMRQLDESGGALPIDATAAQGSMAGNPRQLRQGRLLRVDDEVVATVDAAPGQPPAGQQGAWSDATLLRGALGTTAQAHSSETHGWLLDWPAIAVAEGPIGGYRGQAIPTRRAQGDFRQHFGYAAVDRGGGRPWAGVLPFAERKNDHLVRHVDALDRGAFAHAFGSDQTNTQQNDLLVDLPFRAHDAYSARTSSVRGVYFQAARELPGGYITHVDWDETLPSPFAECLVALRVDGAPGWDADPTTVPGQPGRLYLFDDPRAANQVLLRATRVEVRVYLTFKPGALARDAWKRPAVLNALRVHYRQPSAQLRFEERTE